MFKAEASNITIENSEMKCNVVFQAGNRLRKVEIS